jgi:hypothetical protein
MKNSQRLEQCISFISQNIGIGPGPTRLLRALLHDFFDFVERFPTDAELRALLVPYVYALRNGEHSDEIKDLFPMTTRLIESFYS